eukprot:CAMPEP_0183737780 /NCGR_PEP_ID=MMETSP0737-20130205/52894_1 /TAXON_ID=385413 /ORGANISM="Thalassiosira miniscula, Strain CCMP1093" /LENGTH=482 /DNA_ID=CAMNT_0025972149 /DNA_START=303 /DNA_END=1748 /DNA_ORIENTATION=-
MSDECNVDSILSLMGGTIFHFIVGIKIMWGNIAPYITSYLVQFDPNISYHQTLHVYTAVFLGQSLFMYMGGQLEKKIGPRLTSYLGAFLISGCTYMSSYCKSLPSLIFFQALVGAGIGISYSAPIICCFGHFKQNKGIVTGIITTGTGAGPFLAGLVATTYVNSENYPVDPITGLYDPTTSPVVGRVPSMFRLLGIMYGCIGLVGASLLMRASEEEVQKETALMSLEKGERASLTGNGARNVYDEAMMEEEPTNSMKTSSNYASASGRGHQRYGSRVKFTATYELTTGQMIRDSLCWLLIATAICTGVTGFYVAATYKNFGQTAIADDHFITVVGCFGCLCSGLSRMLWGSTADKIGTFETLELTAYLSPAVMVIYILTVQSKLAFGICVCLLYGLWGASYCLIPAISAFLFGEKHLGTNYGFIFFIFGVSCTIVIDGAGFTGWDFAHLNYVFVVIACIGAALCTRIRYLTSKIKDEKVLRH